MSVEDMYDGWLEDLDKIDSYGWRTGLKGFCSGLDVFGTFGETVYREYKREKGLLSNRPEDYNSFGAKTMASGTNDIEDYLQENNEQYSSLSRVTKGKHFYMGMLLGATISYGTSFTISAANGLADLKSYYDDIKD